MGQIKRPMRIKMKKHMDKTKLNEKYQKVISKDL